MAQIGHSRRLIEPGICPAVARLTPLRRGAEEAGLVPRMFAKAEDIQKIAVFMVGGRGVATLHSWPHDGFRQRRNRHPQGELAIAPEKDEATVVNLEEEQ